MTDRVAAEATASSDGSQDTDAREDAQAQGAGAAPRVLVQRDPQTPLVPGQWFGLPVAPQRTRERRRATRVSDWNTGLTQPLQLHAGDEDELGLQVQQLQEDMGGVQETLTTILEVLQRLTGEQGEGMAAAPARAAQPPGAGGAGGDGAVPQGPPPVVPPQDRGQEAQARKLGVKFDGDPHALPYFLSQVADHMEEWGPTFPNEAAKVKCVARHLKGEAANWLVQLYDCQAAELGSLAEFMRALRARFEDPFRASIALAELKALDQGSRSVSEYALEFRSLVAQVPDCTEGMKIQYFKEGLRPEIVRWALTRGNPPTAMEWIRLAGEAEAIQHEVKMLTQRKIKDPKGKTSRSQTPKSKGQGGSAESEWEKRRRLGLCLKCGNKGHLIAACPDNSKEKKPDPPPAYPPGKAAKGGKGKPKKKSWADRSLQAADGQEIDVWTDSVSSGSEGEPLNFQSLP